MKTRFLTFILTIALALGIFSTSVLSEEISNEKRYELPFYETYIKVSNVVSDNSNEYIKITHDDIGGGEIVDHQRVYDLYIEASAPCKITYGIGDQYINYAKKTEDGSFTSDYERKPRINFDVHKYTFFTSDENGKRTMGDTVDEVSKDSPMNTGADGNYVTVGEGIYIVSNYDPAFRHAGGQSFADYSVILTVKNKVSITATVATSNVLVNKTAKVFDAYTINGNNYFKLRDLAMAVKGTNKEFEVAWDDSKNAINLVSRKEYTAIGNEMQVAAAPQEQNAVCSTAKIYVDGKETALTAYTINGYNYFKLRDIAKVFDIGVTWESATNTIGIDTTTNYIE